MKLIHISEHGEKEAYTFARPIDGRNFKIRKNGYFLIPDDALLEGL